MKTPLTGSVERYPALEQLSGVRHGFTLRVPGLDVHTDRETALQRLEVAHEVARQELGLGGRVLVTAKQVHGADVLRVTAADAAHELVADGLITDDPTVCLGIYVADCCAVYLVDPVRRVIGLLHSGKKGSELGIVEVAVGRMVAEFGSQPGDIVVQLSPCIRPPQYEIDFAAQIRARAGRSGVGQVYDSGVCTASNPERYYSYRRELGKTGRMLALLALADEPR